MTNKTFNLLYLIVSIIILSITSYYVISVNRTKHIDHYVRQCEYICDSLMSKAYFEGQRDAINGDIRIAIKDSTYIWIKSCWDDGAIPLFTPTQDDTYN